MKTKIFTLALVATILCSGLFANAKIRRVGYFTSVPGTDYASIQNAHDAASAGDSIYVFPGSWGTSYISKRLVFISYGYSATSLDSGLQKIPGTMLLTLYLTPGSSGSIVEGFDGLTLNTESANSPGYVDSITISRCNLSINLNGNGTVAQPNTQWQITQSFLNSFQSVYAGGIITNLSISNCVIGTFTFAGLVSGSSSGFLANNIFVGTSNNTNFNNSTFTCVNNIFLCPNLLNSTASAPYFEYNIASGGDNVVIPPGNGDQTNVNLDSIFVGYPTQSPYSNDARYALASKSPAKGAGFGGTDCGIFGGANPYYLGGIPPVPSFYALSGAPFVTTNPYTIYFSVRGNN